MQLSINVNILDHKAAAFLDLLRSLDYVVSIETEQDGSGLSDEEKKLLDVRLAELEKQGPKGISLNEFRAKINDRYGI
jgi:hypothetical protein